MQSSSSRRKQSTTGKRSRSPEVGESLRAWRQTRSFSQSEAASHLRISTRTLQEWEQGRAVPRGIALVSLRKVIGH